MYKLKNNFNKTKLNDYEDSPPDFLLQTTGLGYSVKSQKLNNYSVHINTDILDASHYSGVFDMCLESQEGDTINFFIASHGGDLDGLNVLLEGIRLTDADVRAVLIGPAHSAASIFALNCPNVVVTDSASMLCHNVRTGYNGKIADLDCFTLHTKSIATDLMRKTYEGFFNKKDLEDLIHGKEFWLNADEIRQRLVEREDYLNTKDKENEPEIVILPDIDKPESKSKK